MNLTSKSNNISKKIMYVITSLNYGGTQKQLYYLLKSIKENYCENVIPIVISLKKNGLMKEKIKSLGVVVDNLFLQEKFSLLNCLALAVSMLKYIYLLLLNRPCIVHSFLFQANILNFFTKVFIPECRVILSERVAEKEKKFNLKLTSFFYKKPSLYDKVMVNSQELKKFVIKEQNVLEEKVVVVENIIDLQDLIIEKTETEIREQLGLKKDDFMILSIGRLHKQKGYDLLIEIVRKIKNEQEIKKLSREANILFVVIGDGEEKKVLERKVCNYGLFDYIKFIGYKKNVYDYINACDIFLLTSLWEGSPNVILEAMSFNKPIVSSEVCGVKEIIENLSSCFLVSLEDRRDIVVDNFTKYIKMLFLNRFDKKNDYSFVLKKHFVGNVIKKIEQMYEEFS